MKFITDIGNKKLLVATPLKPVTIKYVAAGSGDRTADKSITSLQDEKWRGDANSPLKERNTLYFGTHIPKNTGGWWWREWGLIDSDGDLIAYGKLDEPIYKALNTMSIEPELPIALMDSVDANIIATDSLNWQHNRMTGRDEASCHPISAIDGLDEKLDEFGEDFNKKIKVVSDKADTNTTGLNNLANRVTSLDNNNVKLSGSQTIYGNKYFANQINAASYIGNGSGLNGATTGSRGVIQIASSSEALAGVNNSNAITPFTLVAGLKSYMNTTGSAPVFGVRAWANFSGASGSIRSRGNISSISRTGTGSYQVIFQTAMHTSVYSVSVSTSGTEPRFGASGASVFNMTNTGFTIQTRYGGDNTTGAFDPDTCTFQVVC